MGMLKNERHEAFCSAIARGASVGRAYRDAGFPGRGEMQSGSRLLKRPEIQARIAELRATVEIPARERAVEKAAISRAWVLEKLRGIAERCTAEGPEFTPTGANRALELLGKELGMFAAKSTADQDAAIAALPAAKVRQLLEAVQLLLASDAVEPADEHGGDGDDTGAGASAALH